MIGHFKGYMNLRLYVSISTQGISKHYESYQSYNTSSYYMFQAITLDMYKLN